MCVDGQLGVERIAAVRAIPRLIDAGFRQDGQPLGAAARRPHRQIAARQHLLRAAPVLAVLLAPVLEIAGQESAQRSRFGRNKGLVKVAEPDLLSLQLRPTLARSGQGNEAGAFARSAPVSRCIDDHSPVAESDAGTPLFVELHSAQGGELALGLDNAQTKEFNGFRLLEPMDAKEPSLRLGFGLDQAAPRPTVLARLPDIV